MIRGEGAHDATFSYTLLLTKQTIESKTFNIVLNVPSGTQTCSSQSHQEHHQEQDPQEQDTQEKEEDDFMPDGI